MDGLNDDVALMDDGVSNRPPSRTVGKSLEIAVAGDRDEKAGEEKMGEAEADDGGEDKWSRRSGDWNGDSRSCC